ncbi:DUF1289 domain-containing protein [Pleionea sp. CnH1-48]|uniref:DUF1289 domain-containing protein n=1 Tax=Pleionea sp. CnH1-48 TaxID=2954494 RepID=UPI0020975C44|nr:DUF1289 domain-containing protein [Pleionea sp. CnH1-48]MCO7224214.1 DUF1289 domain-containing protein [Pleionea sp. CnH1-48]
MKPSPVVASPCVGICKMEDSPANLQELCVGCFRNIDEIIQWASLSDNEKVAVLEQIERRKALENKHS